MPCVPHPVSHKRDRENSDGGEFEEGREEAEEMRGTDDEEKQHHTYVCWLASSVLFSSCKFVLALFR